MNFRLYTRGFVAFAVLLSAVPAMAQDTDKTDSKKQEDVLSFRPKKFFFSNSFDGSILSTAFQSNSLVSLNVGTPRYTYFFNTGFHINYDPNRTIGFFSGIGIKNIGFIEKSKIVKDSTIKRRVYTVGVPLGIKVGNLKKKNYVFAGGGVDFPFNYREKGFVKRGNKDKFNEWFSDRTPRTMPYVFAGASFRPGIFIKFQYYPGNFMNSSYSETFTLPSGITTVVTPYAGYNVQLMMLSIGFDIRYSNKMKITRNKDEEVKTM